MNQSLTRYFRCREQDLPLVETETCCHFRHGSRRYRLPLSDGLLRDALDVVIEDGMVHLPFNPSHVIDNLRRETYADEWRQAPASALADIYYLFRPLLPVGIRKHLQRVRLRGWEKLAFPRWPVDCSVDHLLEQLMLVALRATGADAIPFIWFWPEGQSSCAIMTHDVETAAGKKLCGRMMDIDDSFGIASSFQIIPETRYEVSRGFLDSIRGRGFEIVVHDLNHDGRLFHDHGRFLERAPKINAYGREFGAEGFRAAVLYRNQLWLHALEFSYDMSVPNVGHLDPQRGGCCTIMPYFIGDILEIPVTTTQDYTLFHILNDYSITLWKQQSEIIRQKHGCMSFLVHPDYIGKPREMAVYQQLLEHLARLREEHNVWIAKPGDVNGWWRQRAKMKLVHGRRGLKIVGEGRERARIAYASEDNGRLVFAVDEDSSSKQEWKLEGAEAVCQ